MSGPRPGRTRTIVRVVLFALGGLMIVDALVGDQGLLAMRRASREYQQLEASVARQEAENERRREEVRRLTDDPVAIEDAARRDLGLIRRGERVFILKDLPSPTP